MSKGSEKRRYSDIEAPPLELYYYTYVEDGQRVQKSKENDYMECCFFVKSMLK
ncbi:hypothetical protein C1A50_4275 [Paenibacillus polymyxa]|nr:hypothetical protein C1A50_4275 [Paenibacillus polymyxa]